MLRNARSLLVSLLPSTPRPAVEPALMSPCKPHLSHAGRRRYHPPTHFHPSSLTCFDHPASFPQANPAPARS